MLLLVVVLLLLRAPQKMTREKKTQTKWVELKKKYYGNIAGTGLYVVNGENHGAISLIWYLLSVIILSICFVRLIRFIFIFPPHRNGISHIFTLYWYWSDFHLNIFQSNSRLMLINFVLCIPMRAYKIQLLLNILFFIFENKTHFRKLNWNIWAVLKQVLCTVCTQQTSSFDAPLLIPANP